MIQTGKIVLGLGYGDEGKGLTTSYLCSVAKDPIVVRFSGGHQAGHTVVYEKKRHVFSSFGSGSLQGVPTYWSENCTFCPISFYSENEALFALGVTPKIYVNPLCPVATPYDVAYNALHEYLKDHGTVGVGFGATIKRHEAYYKLYVQDLFNETVLRAKLENIKSYYYNTVGDINLDHFMHMCRMVSVLITLSDSSILDDKTSIFEGSQGILLDQDFGFFPNVTRSNTTSKKALERCCHAEIYYVTRSYQTRHGNGFLSKEGEPVKLINNENETNKEDKFQGKFRTAPLDIDMINYALDCDNHFSKYLKKNLVVTCNDQLPFDLGLLKKINTKFEHVYLSSGPSLTDIVKI